MKAKKKENQKEMKIWRSSSFYSLIDLLLLIYLEIIFSKRCFMPRYIFMSWVSDRMLSQYILNTVSSLKWSRVEDRFFGGIGCTFPRSYGISSRDHESICTVRHVESFYKRSAVASVITDMIWKIQNLQSSGIPESPFPEISPLPAACHNLFLYWFWS